MTISRLAPAYQGRILVPEVGKVSTTPCTDRVAVRLVSGQSVADFAAWAENLANGFWRNVAPGPLRPAGRLVLEFVRRDALAAIIPALPIGPHVNLEALAIGRREDGSVWLVRLHGTHLLVEGAAGAGKGSVLWLIRAMFAAMVALGPGVGGGPEADGAGLRPGRVRPLRPGRYAADPAAIAVMLEDAVAAMHERAAAFAGKHRDHTATVTVCPTCAQRAKTLRAAQCREGWHLEREPITPRGEPDEMQWHQIKTRRSPGTSRPG